MNIIKSILKPIGRFMVGHASEILVGGGLVALGAAVVVTAKETPKAKERLEEAKKEKAEQENCKPEDVKLTLREKVKATFPSILKITACILIGAGMILGANRMDARSKAALGASAAIAESKLASLNEAVDSIDSEETKKEIKEKYDSSIEKKAKNGFSVNSMNTPDRIVEKFSGRSFDATQLDLDRAENELNRRITESAADDCEGVPFGDFTSMFNMNQADVDNDCGWPARSKFSRITRVQFKMGAELIDGVPVKTLTFDPNPETGYSEYVRY